MPPLPNSVNPGSSASPNRLPVVGYTFDQLKDYIFRQLGYPTWRVELTPEQVVDCINDALILCGQYIPRIVVFGIRMVRSQNLYLEGDVEKLGQGCVNVQFVEPLPTPTAVFYANLIDPAPIFRVGIDEYDAWQRWRKTWMRVTSVRPDWYYDKERMGVFIHNPIERYIATLWTYHGYDDTTQVKDVVVSTWIKDYALEKSRYIYGEVLAKYSGVLPGPLQNTTLDQQKRTNAETRLKDLEAKLFGMQVSTPLSID